MEDDLNTLKARMASSPHLARLLLRRRLPAASGALEGAVEAADVEVTPRDATTTARLSGLIASGLPDSADLHATGIADALAAELIARAGDLMNGKSDAFASPDDHVALEAVLMTEGRPALRVGQDGIESPRQHPGSDIWTKLFDKSVTKLRDIASACGALIVTEHSGLRKPWVQGTAWLIGADLVVTNRHVLRPTNGAIILAARRADAPTAGRLRPGVTLDIDFARYVSEGPPSQSAAPVLNVLYMSADDDVLDIAILQIAPRPGLAVPKLKSNGAVVGRRLYVVGHPGRIPLEQLDPRTLAVFGNPDGTKRVGFGQILKAVSPVPQALLHDCSTVGGYSGGPIVDTRDHRVVGLHYFGDPSAGNRAFMLDPLRASPAGQFLEGG